VKTVEAMPTVNIPIIAPRRLLKIATMPKTAENDNKKDMENKFFGDSIKNIAAIKAIKRSGDILRSNTHAVSALQANITARVTVMANPERGINSGKMSIAGIGLSLLGKNPNNKNIPPVNIPT
jgi:hypothetical protein